MTNTIKKNAYRMLVLAGMILLMAANLSQPAFAEGLERPGIFETDCIKRYADDFDENGWERVVKFHNTCKESWTFKYFYRYNPTTLYEQILDPGESFIIHKEMRGWRPHRWYRVVACPSNDDTISAVSESALSDDPLVGDRVFYSFECAWR